MVVRGARSIERVVDIRGPYPVIDGDLYHREKSGYERFVKPLLDIVGALLLIAILAPVMATCVVVIWVTMGGPVLLRQERVGRFGQPFTLYKFRTMIPDRRHSDVAFTGEDRRRSHKTESDPRVTPIGKHLRRLSLDELPQFFNVLMGDMSLVGPRPELPSIVRGYEDWQHRRHAVRPGITGLWQVSERGSTPLHEATEHDLDYIEHLAFTADVSILWKTPFAAFGKRTGF